MKIDLARIRENSSPYLVLVGLYVASALLSWGFAALGDVVDDYSAFTAYLFGFLYLPLGFGGALLRCGLPESMGVVAVLAYWPITLLFVFLYMRFKHIAWAILSGVMLLAPCTTIAAAFSQSMGV